jgi:hypothetical protein
MVEGFLPPVVFQWLSTHFPLGCSHNIYPVVGQLSKLVCLFYLNPELLLMARSLLSFH